MPATIQRAILGIMVAQRNLADIAEDWDLANWNAQKLLGQALALIDVDESIQKEMEQAAEQASDIKQREAQGAEEIDRAQVYIHAADVLLEVDDTDLAFLILRQGFSEKAEEYLLLHAPSTLVLVNDRDAADEAASAVQMYFALVSMSQLLARRNNNKAPQYALRASAVVCGYPHLFGPEAKRFAATIREGYGVSDIEQEEL